MTHTVPVPTHHAPPTGQPSAAPSTTTSTSVKQSPPSLPTTGNAGYLLAAGLLILVVGAAILVTMARWRRC